MKKVCFIEMEGILTNYKDYTVDNNTANKFIADFKSFSKENNIKLYLLSGHHEKIAKEKFNNSFLKDFFSEDEFIFVDDNYIQNKHETDKMIHESNLEKDIEFSDSYFKQIIIQKILKELNLENSDALLFCKDVWVDAYYTTRFSKIDFALFETNLLDRGKKTDLISGLVYYNFDFNKVKELIENFPKLYTAQLEKKVNDEIKNVLLKDTDFSGLNKKRS
ncbi:MAG: hypothetical protein PHQ98_01000 [Candidatus ainarchaeum sp.]|nr:hypothetical protein [Candidatus ainarchaeum sp.]